MSVIAFEGLDGVGKTTAAHGLAEFAGGLVASSAEYLPRSWAAQRREVNTGNDVESRFSYFVKINEAQMSLARRIDLARPLATLDTSIFRTVATHRVLGSMAAMSYEIPPWIMPDRTFYLDIDEDERQRRLAERDGAVMHPSRWDELLFERQDQLREAYTAFGLTILDATGGTDAIVDQARRHLNV